MEAINHMCEICTETFPNKWSLILHQRCHNGENNCSLCELKFDTIPQLLKHLNFHILRRESKIFQCGVCLKKFEHEQQLRRHFENHINGIQDTEVQITADSKQTLYVCPICDESCLRSDLCQQHLLKHVMQLNCSLCGKTFSKYDYLVNHTRKHTRESLLQCDQCQKTFYTKVHLERHKRIHSGETPFVCDTCSKTFSRKDNLSRHLRSHHISTVECTLCAQEFRTLGYLKIHMSRSHTNDLRFKCNLCGKSFFTAGNLQFHKKTHKSETLIGLEISIL